MALKLENKKAIVAKVNQAAESAVFGMVASYRGLTVAQMTELRTKARQAGLFLQVVRNTLARRAVENTAFACMQEALVGPMVLIFSPADPGEAARVARDFSKDNKLLEVVAVSFGETLLPGKHLTAVAELPSHTQAISLLMSVMTAPITKYVRTLSETYAQCVRVVSAVAEKQRAA